MRVMWIVNCFVGELEKKYRNKLTSGQWLNAEIEKEKSCGQNNILICTSGTMQEILQDGFIKYIVLPHGNLGSYIVDEASISDCERVLVDESPDVILVWGTEYNLGRCMLLANKKRVPSVIYIQGVMSSIAKYYRGGLTDKEINKFSTLVERIRHTTIFDIEKKYQANAENEKEYISLSDGIIVENNWAIEQYLKIDPTLQIYKSRLPIKSTFLEFQWVYNNCKKRSILTTAAASSPMKGLFIMVSALKILKKNYQDVMLIIPGFNDVIVHGIKARLHQSGYGKWIERTITRNNLSKNIKFIGPQTSEQYAKLMESAQVFISSSAIENHSSTIREAMSVGVPCVSSRVGGVTDFARDHVNCSLYEYSDVEELAKAIAELFEKKELCEQYSVEGKKTIKYLYIDNPLLSLNEIYNKLISSK